jgi:hypothetical protein
MHLDRINKDFIMWGVIMDTEAMECYFCKTDLKKQYKGLLVSHLKCFNCADSFNLSRIYTTYVSAESKKPKDLECVNAHVYVAMNNKKYHVRFSLKENTTYVFSYDKESNKEMILTLDGLPLNLSNMKNKLHTYLVFS